MVIENNIVSIINLASNYPVISRVGVFGSYARGEQSSDSDIDILFDYDVVNEDYVLEVLEYGEELIEGLGKLNIDVDYISLPGVMQSSNNKVRDSILKDVIWLYRKL